jgi:hypothetical protein
LPPWDPGRNNVGIPRSVTHIAAFGSSVQLEDLIIWLDRRFLSLQAGETLRAEPIRSGAALAEYVDRQTRASLPPETSPGGVQLGD